MGEHRESGHVAGGVDIGYVGAHVLVDLDASLGCDAEILETVALEHGAASDGHENLVSADAADLSVGVFIHYGVAFDSGHLALQAEFDSALRVDFLEHGADFVVHGSENLRQHLHHGHLGAESVEERRELHSDHAASDDHELLGLLPEREDLTVGDDHVAGLLESGERRHGCFGTRADEQVLRRVFLASGSQGDAFGRAALYRRMFGHDLYLAGLHGGLDAAYQLLDDLVLAVDDFGVVEGRLLDIDSVVVAGEGVIVDLGAVEQRLCGDASFVEADAAEGVLFEDHGLQTGGSRSFCGYIAAGAAPENC